MQTAKSERLGMELIQFDRERILWNPSSSFGVHRAFESVLVFSTLKLCANAWSRYIKTGCFFSTPSIYFPLREEERIHCTLFDVRFSFLQKHLTDYDLILFGWIEFHNLQMDETLSNDQSFVRYDFEHPLDFPFALQHTFDMLDIVHPS